MPQTVKYVVLAYATICGWVSSLSQHLDGLLKLDQLHVQHHQDMLHTHV